MMRRTPFLIVLGLIFLHVNNTYAQTAKINLQMENTPLREVIRKIQESTEFTFFYSLEDIKGIKVKSINVSEASLEETLDQCLKNTGLTYEIKHKAVVLSKIADQSEAEVKVAGRITDNEGLPLPGATVLIKGTYKGITTDKEGNYAIKVPGPQTILVFSFVGFKSQEITVGVQSTIDVTMEQATTELEEVTINAGYYTVKEREKTGNISRIAAKEIEQQPVSNPLQALQGRMPGVNIVQNSGVPGGGFTVRIRGQNSLRWDGNEPLYIVDGVPFTSIPINRRQISFILPNSVSPFNSINPSNIESIEILKDADATAIYGSRGANGVVLITTKKGRPGDMKVNVNYSQGFGEVANKMELLNTQQYREMRREAFINDGWWPFPERYLQHRAFVDMFQWDSTRYTDWQEKLIGGTANVTNLQASLYGGNNNTHFLIGAGYYRETTVYPTNAANKKGSANFSITHRSPDQKFRVQLTTNFTTDILKLPSIDLTDEAITLPPNAPELYDEEGRLNWENSTWVNPLAELEKKFRATTDNLISNLDINYQFLPSLNIKANLGYTNVGVDQISTFPLSARDPAKRSRHTGFLSITNGSIKTWIIEPQIQYQRSIAKGRLNIIIGSTFQQTIHKDKLLVAYGYTSDALIENLQAATDVTVDYSREIDQRYNAFFGRINYNWDEKYILNLTGRRDGSSRFGKDRQFSNFGGIGIAWIFSNESFIKRSGSFLSFGKLRASYGITGSDQIQDYQYLDSYRVTTYPYQEIKGLIPSRIANPEFGWEQVKKLEVAMELSFFQERLSLSASWYKNRSSNQLVGFPLPATTGAFFVQANSPATVENKGWEFMLSSINIKSINFQWDTYINISIHRNKLLDYPNLETSPYANTYKIGKSLYISPRLHFTGIDPETGIATFEDVDGNGNSTDYPNDYQFLKEIAQDYSGGIQNTFRYKGLELNVFVQFVKQSGKAFLSNFLNSPGGIRSNFPHTVLDRWQKPGDITNIPKYSQFDSDARNAYYRMVSESDAVITDASFIRLKNVSLFYKLPSKLTKNLGLKTAKIYIQGQNLLTITDYEGLDPETQSLSLPPLRMITTGVQFTF